MELMHSVISWWDRVKDKQDNKHIKQQEKYSRDSVMRWLLDKTYRALYYKRPNP
jgi:hypothetical protein